MFYRLAYRYVKKRKKIRLQIRFKTGFNKTETFRQFAKKFPRNFSQKSFFFFLKSCVVAKFQQISCTFKKVIKATSCARPCSNIMHFDVNCAAVNCEIIRIMVTATANLSKLSKNTVLPLQIYLFTPRNTVTWLLPGML